MKKKLLFPVLFLSLATQQQCFSQLTIPAATYEYVLDDFEDGILKDEKWALDSNAYLETFFYIKPRGADSGADSLYIGIGDGKNGGNALVVYSNDSAANGIPGFWILNGDNRGSWIGGQWSTDDDLYLSPRGKKVNRLEFDIRFEKGFRKNASAKQPPVSPNHQNLHVGTYMADPASGNRRETHNFHFYHQMFFRHDLADSNWIHVVINDQPQHQRSISMSPSNNPTAKFGNMWELLTRFYIDPVPYFSSSEIGWPCKMWVDNIKLSYVPVPNDISIEIENYVDGQIVHALPEVNRDFKVVIRNTSSRTITGVVCQNIFYRYLNSLRDNLGNLLPSPVVSISGNDSLSLILRISPDSLILNNLLPLGITFVEQDTTVTGTTFVNKSYSTNYLEKRWYPLQGPHDCISYGAHFFCKVATPPSNEKPSLIGGMNDEIMVGQVFNGQIKASDPEKGTLTYHLVWQDTSAGNVVINATTGAYTYTPKAGFVNDYFTFKFLVTDPVGDSSHVGVSWIRVSPNTVGIKNMSKEKNLDFVVYPNPANDKIIVKSNFSEKNVLLTLVDIQGKTVYAKKLDIHEKEEYVVDVSNLSSGVYVIQIKGSSNIIQNKVFQKL